MASALDFIEGESFLHKAHPVAKLALVASICIATFLAKHIAFLLALILLSLALGVSAGAFKRSFSLLRNFSFIALLLFLVQTLLFRGGTSYMLWFSEAGVQKGLFAALRLLSFALPLMIILSITKMSDLANALVEKLHVPYRYAFTITTALRFVPIFSNEMSHIMEAQCARGVAYDTKNPLKKIRLMLPMIVPLLISSVAKVDQSALAAEQRGFYLRGQKSAYKRYPYKAADFALFTFSIVLIVVSVWL